MCGYYWRQYSNQKSELHNPLDIALDTYCVDNTAEWLRSLVGTHAERLL